MRLEEVIKQIKKYLNKEQKETLRQALKDAGYRIKLSLDFATETWQYTIHKVWWKGPTVIRDMPFEDYYLRKKRGDEYHYYLISGDYEADTFGLIPLEDEDDLLDKKWFNYEGEVPPESAYNPNKRLKAKDEILDRGTMEIDTDNHIVVFRGKVLKGKYRYEGKWKEGPVLYKLIET